MNKQKFLYAYETDALIKKLTAKKKIYIDGIFEHNAAGKSLSAGAQTIYDVNRWLNQSKTRINPESNFSAPCINDYDLFKGALKIFCADEDSKLQVKWSKNE